LPLSTLSSRSYSGEVRLEILDLVAFPDLHAQCLQIPAGNEACIGTAVPIKMIQRPAVVVYTMPTHGTKSGATNGGESMDPW